MILVLLSIAQTGGKPVVFDTTYSGSKRFVVACIDTGKSEDDENKYVNRFCDTKTKKTVVLKGFNGFPNENHGGVNAVYSKQEDFAVVIHQGKWQPRGLVLIATKSMTQLSILAKVQKDARTYASSHKPFKGQQLVFDVSGAKFVGSKLSFSIIAQVPKQEFFGYLSETYSYSQKGGKLRLEKPEIKAIPESAALQWGK